MTSKEAGPPSLHPPSESAFATSASSELTTTTITTTHNPTLKDDDLEFLFREEEFEEDSFDAAAFVAKYRRVSSLESLREQLVAYSKHIKSHLYLIINRDYKDFITISTKVSLIFDVFPRFSVSSRYLFVIVCD